MKVISNAIIYTGDHVLKDCHILTNKGEIIGVQKEIPDNASVIDLKGKNISAGFIDIQLNGGSNYYFSEKPDLDTLQDMYATSSSFGTPFFFPTLISSSNKTILSATEAVKQFKKANPGMPGMHLEGPFINPEKKGAHSAEIIRKPSDTELETIIEQGNNLIGIMTIAPECFTDKQIERLLKTDIVLSIGHSSMTYQEAQHYFSMGIRLVTHLYNAMTQMGHRECGIVGAVFDNDTVYAPIILDGAHCHYASARIAYRQKGDKLFLITDSSLLGRHKKKFNMNGSSIEMVDGYYRNQEGSLAGAAISLPEAMKNAMDFVGVTLQEAVQMVTCRPARAIQMADQLGFIDAGYPAVFTVFDDHLFTCETLHL